MQNHEIVLPRYTNRTNCGPKIEHYGSDTMISYDYEEDSGEITWIKLKFKNVLAIRYHTEALAEADDVTGFSSIKACSAEIEIGVAHRNHSGYNVYKIYFDDDGLVEVISEGVSIDNM